VRIRANFLVVGLVVGAGLAHGQVRDDHNGYWWLQQDRLSKLGWLMGFADGVEAQRDSVIAACLDQGSTEASTAAQRQSVVEVCNNNAWRNFFLPPKVTFRQVIDGIDHFYADDRNKSLGVDVAVLYVYMQRNGASQAVLDDYCRKARKKTIQDK